MKQIFSEYKTPLNMSCMELLSEKGSEFLVYKYHNSVVKIYKEDYKLDHLSKKELNILKKIKTKRILLPTGLLYDENKELIGYRMPFVDGQKNIEQENVLKVFNELEILNEDIKLLSTNNVLLRDVNLSNTIYNGSLYLIDSGNYVINELYGIIFHIDISNYSFSNELNELAINGEYEKIRDLIDSLSKKEKDKIILEWNYKKINELLDLLLFAQKEYIDFYQYRSIIQYIIKLKYENNLEYNLDALKLILDTNLCIKDATIKFMNQYIKDDFEKKYLIYMNNKKDD